MITDVYIQPVSIQIKDLLLSRRRMSPTAALDKGRGS